MPLFLCILTNQDLIRHFAQKFFFVIMHKVKAPRTHAFVQNDEPAANECTVAQRSRWQPSSRHRQIAQILVTIWLHFCAT